MLAFEIGIDDYLFSHPYPLSRFPKKDGGKKAAAAPAAKKQAVHEDEVAVVTVMTREHDSDEEVRLSFFFLSFLTRVHAFPTPLHARTRVHVLRCVAHSKRFAIAMGIALTSNRPCSIFSDLCVRVRRTTRM